MHGQSHPIGISAFLTRQYFLHALCEYAIKLVFDIAAPILIAAENNPAAWQILRVVYVLAKKYLAQFPLLQHNPVAATIVQAGVNVQVDVVRYKKDASRELGMPAVPETNHSQTVAYAANLQSVKPQNQ